MRWGPTATPPSGGSRRGGHRGHPGALREGRRGSPRSPHRGSLRTGALPAPRLSPPGLSPHRGSPRTAARPARHGHRPRDSREKCVAMALRVYRRRRAGGKYREVSRRSGVGLALGLVLLSFEMVLEQFWSSFLLV